MQTDTRWFRSPYVGVVSFSVRKQMSYSASLSSTITSSAFSTSWCTDSVALYGSTTVSDTFGDGLRVGGAGEGGRAWGLAEADAQADRARPAPLSPPPPSHTPAAAQLTTRRTSS